MFGIGSSEFVLILLIALLVFGPERLMEFARVAGRLVRQWRGTTEQLKSRILSETKDEGEGPDR